MRLLLDTHAFLWWVNDQPELSRRARRAIGRRENECLLSVASCWEMAIKVGLGKLKIPGDVEHFVSEHLAGNGFGALDISLRHVAAVSRLAFHHRDPFDHLLVAQAIEEDLAIMSSDQVFHQYKVRRIW